MQSTGCKIPVTSSLFLFYFIFDLRGSVPFSPSSWGDPIRLTRRYDAENQLLVQSLDRSGRREDMTDDSANILLQRKDWKDLVIKESSNQLKPHLSEEEDGWQPRPFGEVMTTLRRTSTRKRNGRGHFLMASSAGTGAMHLQFKRSFTELGSH